MNPMGLFQLCCWNIWISIWPRLLLQKYASVKYLSSMNIYFAVNLLLVISDWFTEDIDIEKIPQRPVTAAQVAKMRAEAGMRRDYGFTARTVHPESGDGTRLPLSILQGPSTSADIDPVQVGAKLRESGWSSKLDERFGGRPRPKSGAPRPVMSKDMAFASGMTNNFMVSDWFNCCDCCFRLMAAADLPTEPGPAPSTQLAMWLLSMCPLVSPSLPRKCGRWLWFSSLVDLVPLG